MSVRSVRTRGRDRNGRLSGKRQRHGKDGGDLNGAIGKGFSMDYEGAQNLLTFVQGIQVAVAKVLRRSDILAQEPQLGSTPAANVYKPYLPTIATDPDQGFIPVMTRTKQQLDQAVTNIQASLTAYEQNEQNVAGSLVDIFQATEPA